MDPELLSAISGCLGAALVGTALFYCLPRRINGVAADTVVLKLVRAGNLDRVNKLISAAPNTYLAAYGAAIEAAERVGSKQPAEVKAASHAAFTTVADALAKRWVSAIMRGIVGGMLGGVSLYVGQRHGGNAPTWVRAVGGIAVLGGVWSLLRRNDVANVLEHGERDVLPEIDRAFTGTPVESEANVEDVE
ncbi:hypothetical protein BH11MYX1_BH11MYX1_27580 [soil metagenome]